MSYGMKTIPTSQGPGYRELSPEEKDLLARINAIADQMRALVADVVDHASMVEMEEKTADGYADFEDAQPFRWVSIAQTDLQSGLMALRRAVTRYRGF